MVQVELNAAEIKDKKVYQEWGLSDEEYSLITDDILKRLPNFTETGLFSVMWSEHCSYKNSKPVLRKFPSSGPQVIQGPGEGAGIVDIGDGQAVVFKAESHNHPSAVAPYEGAATGVGGIIRDIFSMGARPVAVLDSLRFGELTDDRTKYLFDEVIAGISGYGNAIGIPTIGGEIAFDDVYKGNPLVNVMCVGLIDHKDIQKGQAAGVGNAIIYVGAKTGRDGIHGATFASEEFNDETESDRSAVQVGDPFMEKLLLEACLEVIHNHSDVLVGIQDMGAAGLVSSSAEMASKAGSGLVLNLDDVPQREADMTPYEMMLSESQERMLLCVKKGHEQEIYDVFEKYDLHAVNIGYVTDDSRYRLYHHGIEVADVPVDALAEDAPVYHRQSQKPARISRFEKMSQYQPINQPAEETLKALLAQPTIASKRAAFETFDSQVRTSTVVGPGSDAAVLRVRGTQKALAMTTDCNARFIYLDPKVGGQMAVAEAARNIVASGGQPLAITDCLNYGNPEDPETFYELSESADGIAEACLTLDTPVISGNVSLYNESNGQAIYPTPMIGMVGLIKNVDHITTQDFKQAGDTIFMIGETGNAFNGSELQKLETGNIDGPVYAFDLASEKANQAAVLAAIEAGYIQSAHDLAEGGLGVALAESTFANNMGAQVTLDMPAVQLFAENPSRFIVTVANKDKDAFLTAFGQAFMEIGRVTDDGLLSVKTNDQAFAVATADLNDIFENAIPNLLEK